MTIRIPGPFQQVSAANKAAIVSSHGELTHTDDAKVYINGDKSNLLVVDQLGAPKSLTVAQVLGQQSAAPHVIFISDDARPSVAFYDPGRDKWINALDGLEVAA